MQNPISYLVLRFSEIIGVEPKKISGHFDGTTVTASTKLPEGTLTAIYHMSSRVLCVEIHGAKRALQQQFNGITSTAGSYGALTKAAFILHQYRHQTARKAA